MHSNRGAALVFVLLIVATLSIVAVQINEQIRFNVKRLDNQRQNAQAYWYAIGGEALAVSLLKQLDNSEPVHLGQAWATEDAVFPIEGGVLQGRITDAQACFNVNNLQVQRTPGEAPPAESAYEKQFVAILAQGGIDRTRAIKLRDRVQDWLDSDQLPNGLYGAEDLEYSDREQPFQAANRLISHISELNLLDAYSGEEFQVINSAFCALPSTDTAININTLQPEQADLLVALLASTVSSNDAKLLLEQRPEEGWESITQFFEDPLLAGKAIPEDYRDKLTVQSGFFRATINVIYRDTQFNLITLMKLSDDKATVLTRRYGELF